MPEAQEGGGIALVEDGDQIEINSETREINVKLEDSVLEERRRRWKAPPLKYTSGTLYKFAK